MQQGYNAAEGVPITRLEVNAFRIPTDAPEADGTIAWNATTMVVVTVAAGGHTGLGYTYAAAAAADVIRNIIADVVHDQDAFAIPRLWEEMVAAVRNVGRQGIAACAVSAVDVALWDLKARLLEVPLAVMLGLHRSEVEIYGSGGFTSYSVERLCAQLAGWVERQECRYVKMKVGSRPDQDSQRVAAARQAVGNAGLYVDANGAYTRKQALRFAELFGALGVEWFEEPVSSDDLDGLRLLRDRGPAGMEIAAGEYGYDQFHFRRMLESGAVDVLQADATRCGGYTGFLRAAALADAWCVPLSAHTAPSLHLPVCCAVPRLRNIEWFHDHARIEQALLEGSPKPRNGKIRPDLSAHGHGLSFKLKDAEHLTRQHSNSAGPRR
jgi:L-alanine-DL-glutamate epimerase-like enolase superfamily enzyme